MRADQYVVLHGGDRILMKENLYVSDLEYKQAYLNANLEKELQYYHKDIREAADYIELEQVHVRF